MGLRRYRELLRIPGVTPLLLAAFVARLPYGMFIARADPAAAAEGFDYAAVGIVTAASGLSVGVAAPLLGRVIDRVGQTRVLRRHRGARRGDRRSGSWSRRSPARGTALLTLLALAGGLTRPAGLRPRCGRCCPASSAASGSTRRSRSTRSSSSSCSSPGRCWPPGSPPLISPEVAVLTAVALQTAGALGVAASPASRRWRPAQREPGDRRAGALSSPRACARSWPRCTDHGDRARRARDRDPGLRRARRARAATPAGCSRSGASARSPAGSGTARASGAAAPHGASSSSPPGLTVGLAPLPLAGSLPVFAVLVVVAGPRPRALDRGLLLAGRRARAGGRGDRGLRVADRRLRRRQRGRRVARRRGRRGGRRDAALACAPAAAGSGCSWRWRGGGRSRLGVNGNCAG